MHCMYHCVCKYNCPSLCKAIDNNAPVNVNPGGPQAYDRVRLTIQGTLTTAILSYVILISF